jgi:hypothetical protein
MKKLILNIFWLVLISGVVYTQPVIEWEDNFRDSTGNEYYKDMAYDNAGNVYAVGKSSTKKGDIFLVKYSPSGSKLWVKKYDYSLSNETPFRVFYDASGYIYVVGISDQFAKQNILVLKYTSSGSLVWSNLYSPGSPYFDQASECKATMFAGRIYIFSNTRESVYYKCVLYKINSDGTYLRSVIGVSSKDNSTSDICLDPIGNIYVLYSTWASPTNACYVSKFNNSLVLSWNKTIIDTVNSVIYPKKIALNTLEKVIVSGYTPYDDSYRNGRVFVTSLNSSDGAVNWYKRFSPLDSLQPTVMDMKIDRSNSIILGGYYRLGRTGSSLTKGMLCVFKHTGSLIKYNIVDSMDVVENIAVDSISNIFATGFSNRYNTVHKYNPSGILQWRAVTSQYPYMNKILFVKPDIFYTCGRDRTTPTYKFYLIKYKLNPGSLKPRGNSTDELNNFSLDENYPNPFNPSTTIRFSLPENGVTTLKVYDISGSEVSSLVDGNLEAGEHEVNFNASNLASGTYFYRLTSGSFTDVKKMMLVK